MSSTEIQKPTLLSGKPTNGRFSARLKWLLAGRKPTPWAASLGISGSTRNAMINGDVPPSADALARIMRFENASISWLLGANVAPFLRSTACTDADTAELLSAHLAEEDWRVVLLTDGMACAWVLHQPASILQDGVELPYRAVTVIAGPSGRATESALATHGHRMIRHAQDVSTSDLRAIIRGQLGTWRLFGDNRHPGLIRGTPDPYAHGAPFGEVVSDYARHIADAGPGYNPAALPTPAQVIADAWDSLGADRRSALELVVAGLVNPLPATP